MATLEERTGAINTDRIPGISNVLGSSWGMGCQTLYNTNFGNERKEKHSLDTLTLMVTFFLLMTRVCRIQECQFRKFKYHVIVLLSICLKRVSKNLIPSIGEMHQNSQVSHQNLALFPACLLCFHLFLGENCMFIWAALDQPSEEICAYRNFAGKGLTVWDGEGN